MKKNLFLLIIITLFNNGILFSQNLKISGNVNKPEALVRLFSYKDMLSCEQNLLAQTYADKKGDFVVTADIDEIRLAQIAIDLERVDMLLKPNSNYEIELIIPEQDENVSYFERRDPTLRMIMSDDNELYYQYSMSEMIIDDFVLENFYRLYRNRQSTLLDSLDAIINAKFGNNQDDFINDYVRYRKASIQMAVNNDNAKKVVNQYFNKQKVLYSQPAYMDLFKEIFTDYYLSRQFEPSEFYNKLYSGFDSFSSYLKEKDTFLANNIDLFEVIMAWNLRRMYYENPDDRKLILSYFDKIKDNTKNPKNKELVNDIMSQIDRLSYNSQAPDFSLKNKDGKNISLSDLKNDVVILQFVNGRSSMIDYHFDKLKELSYQWQDSVKIVTIATADSFDDFRQMFDNESIIWELLNLDNDILLLEKYQIRTFPDYIILRRGGRIGMAPAPAPDQYLDFHVRRIYKYL